MSIDIPQIELLKEGNRRAFRQFVDFYSSQLFYYALGIIKNESLAEEIVSDVFMEVWNNRNELNNINNIKKWMLVITYRKSISQLRKKAERPHVNIEDVSDFQFSPLQNPEEALISKEELARINGVIENLPAKCRHVFFLAKVERLSYKEISEMLNISVKTVNNHITHALKEIIKGLKKTSE